MEPLPFTSENENFKELYLERKARLIEAAREARDNDARSYRGFLVGCSVLGRKADRGASPETGYEVYSTGNFKPEKKPQAGYQKRCAERNTIQLALNENCNFIPAICTISDQASTEPGASEHDVLHPCEDCRSLLKEIMDQGHISSNTVLCSVRDGVDPEGQVFEKVEERTVGELLSIYEKDSEKNITLQ